MDHYSPEFIEDEPLDLSIKPRANKPANEKQASAVCLAKAYDYGSHSKHFHDQRETQSAPVIRYETGNSGIETRPRTYDNHRYSAFSVKARILRDCESYKEKYSIPDNNQINTSYHRHSPPKTSYSAYPNTIGNIHHATDHSLHAPPPRNQSTTAYSYPSNEKPEGRFDVGYLSQSDCPTRTSLMDFFNDSIEVGLRKDKPSGDNPARLKREYVESMDESRYSPSDSKRHKPEGRPVIRQFNSPLVVDKKDQITQQEKIDVVGMNEPESSNLRNSSPVATEPKENCNTSNDKTQEQFKQNISLPPRKKSGSKVLDLDYMISKVLLDRGDIPNAQRAQPHSIKRIYCGEGKGQLKLIDLIELQVEESLKA
ncbi:hypothetical protein LOTGIDRAFT_228417 [Lottia gigantea]|uniref:Uncharacterized protein n=1 Tax=Lottia gigantea TaxID=225164 RepID=V4C857_LOTGI|nr:hypothetical protein LOTGIDRAFT_228417 [Lottia gigantea]ESO97884.1 hypothetical protein LOTGIDRAFT_228417 [Lottia gigantea]